MFRSIYARIINWLSNSRNENIDKLYFILELLRVDKVMDHKTIHVEIHKISGKVDFYGNYTINYEKIFLVSMFFPFYGHIIEAIIVIFKLKYTYLSLSLESFVAKTFSNFRCLWMGKVCNLFTDNNVYVLVEMLLNRREFATNSIKIVKTMFIYANISLWNPTGRFECLISYVLN